MSIHEHLSRKRLLEAAVMLGVVAGSVLGFAAKTTLDRLDPHQVAATFDERFGQWDRYGGGWIPHSYGELLRKHCVLPNGLQI